MQLVWSVFALTVATLTLALAARRIAILVGELVYARYVAVGGMVAFSVDGDDGRYRVRFEVGGPGVFHNVGMQLLPAGAAARPPRRHTVAVCDEVLEWTLEAAPGESWVLVTWVRPYLQGVESEALAQRLGSDQLYEWRWYSDSARFFRTVIRAAAQRFPRLFSPAMRELSVYGRWRKTTSTSSEDLLGPADRPPG